MRLTNVGAALNRLRRSPTRCMDPVWTKPRGQGGRPTASARGTLPTMFLMLINPMMHESVS